MTLSKQTIYFKEKGRISYEKSTLKHSCKYGKKIRCRGWTRTTDHKDMSLVCYRLHYPTIFSCCKGTTFL